MKKSALILSVLIAALFLLPGFKSADGFSIEVDSSYVTSSGEDVSAVAERLNLPQDTVKSFFENEGLKFIAVSGDALKQIKLSSFEDKFSNAVYDSKSLNEEQMLALFGSLSDKVTIVQNGERTYAKTKEVHKDSGGVYTVAQYLTVAGGKTWLLSCYNPGDQISDDTESVFKSLSFETKDDKIADIDSQIDECQTKKNWVLPFIIVACAVLVAGGVELFFNIRKNR